MHGESRGARKSFGTLCDSGKPAPRHSAAGCAHATARAQAATRLQAAAERLGDRPHAAAVSVAPPPRGAAARQVAVRVPRADGGLQGQAVAAAQPVAVLVQLRGQRDRGSDPAVLVLTPLLAVTESAALLADRQGAGSILWSAALAWHCSLPQSGTLALGCQGRTRTTTALPQ